LLHYCIELL